MIEPTKTHQTRHYPFIAQSYRKKKPPLYIQTPKCNSQTEQHFQQVTNLQMSSITTFFTSRIN